MAQAVAHVQAPVEQSRAATERLDTAKSRVISLNAEQQASTQRALQQAEIVAASAIVTAVKAAKALQDVGADSLLDARLSFVTKEYETLAKQWEELWKTGASTFSYLVIAAGTIVTFGTAHLRPEAVMALAYVPILAWAICISSPFKPYGGSLS